jgi:hypothetical protein
MKKIVGLMIVIASILASCGNKPAPRYLIDDILEAGDGYVIVRCQECIGGQVQCPSCNGFGTISNDNNEQSPCQFCEGSGAVDCLECKGTGKIKYNIPHRY